MRIRTGTSGYSYKEWRGAFYPADAKPQDMLRFYSTRLATVEINNTFYRMPTEKMLLAWSEQVPQDFSFVLKASRRITHNKRLADAGEALGYLLQTTAVLGAKRGPFLFQLPPHFKKDLPRLEAFVEQLPREVPAAFEFRHDSWFDDEVADVLRTRGVALVVADTDGADEPVIRPTARYGYLRLRRESYDDAALAAWAGRVREQPWDDAYVFFKHEGEALAAAYAEKLARLAAG